MADEEIATEMAADPSQTAPEQGPLVALTFEKKPHTHKLKYLEAEPKALGVTEIVLSVFHCSCVSIILNNGLSYKNADIVHMVLSLLVVIAGILAIAAQSLHPPTLKACLWMQVVACAVSAFNMCLYSVTVQGGRALNSCWDFVHEFNTTDQQASSICDALNTSVHHYTYGNLLVNAALVAISATLAAYCCKVDNCCTSTSRTPVITVQAPPVQH